LSFPQKGESDTEKEKVMKLIYHDENIHPQRGCSLKELLNAKGAFPLAGDSGLAWGDRAQGGFDETQ